jgi:nitrite reductase/ring-hydroxylating ferredoxin subunit
MAELEVARLAELEEGVPRPVQAFGREIALIRWQDECFAVRNICPHQTVPFNQGVAQGQVRPGAGFGEIIVDHNDPVLRCPRHAWKFALRTGQCTIDPRLRIRAYPVSIRDGRVFVADDRR